VPLAALSFAVGLRVPKEQGPLVILILIFNIGGLLALTQVRSYWDTAPIFVAVSFFLAFKCIYLAATMVDQPNRVTLVMNAYIASAMVAAILGTVGYLLQIEELTRADRAKGLFKDPNVFGPYLTLPAVWVAREVLVHGLKAGLFKIIALIVLFIGIFFSFSRAAWGLFGFSLMAIGLLVFINEQDVRKRLRMLIMFIAAIGLLIGIVAIMLSIDSIRDLFLVRAKLVQDYDGARLGRFARHEIAFVEAMRLPLGIGPFEFMNYFNFPEDPHNVYLKALMVYGWVGAFGYYVLAVWSLVGLVPLMFKNRVWAPLAQCVFVVLLGHQLISWIIDSDHWRHFYILWAFAWALIALDKIQTRRGTTPGPDQPPPRGPQGGRRIPTAPGPGLQPAVRLGPFGPFRKPGFQALRTADASMTDDKTRDSAMVAPVRARYPEPDYGPDMPFSGFAERIVEARRRTQAIRPD
jgi:O-antigen ligase